MIKIRQFHIRNDDTVTGIMKFSTPIKLPIHVYLSAVDMTMFIRKVVHNIDADAYMFKGTAVYGRHPIAKIESDATGFVCTEALRFINTKEKIDVQT